MDYFHLEVLGEMRKHFTIVTEFLEQYIATNELFSELSAATETRHFKSWTSFKYATFDLF